MVTIWSVTAVDRNGGTRPTVEVFFTEKAARAFAKEVRGDNGPEEMTIYLQSHVDVEAFEKEYDK